MNFKNKFDKYEEHAHVQKAVANNLIKATTDNFLDKNQYSTIFEIGCGTGILTRKLIESFRFKNLILNDKFNECRSEIQDLAQYPFILGDVEKINLPKSDLVISSSVFQWIENKDLLFKNISQSSQKLIFSIYIKDNLIEISNHFGVSLKYDTVENLNNILLKYYKDVKYFTEDIVLTFETPLKALKHLKNTGVTGIGQSNIKKIKEYKKKKLTYKVGYFICQ